MKNKKLIKTCIMVFILLSIPSLAFADTASDISTIDGAQELINLFDVYVRGTGAIIFFIGLGEMFLTLSTERIEHQLRTLMCICAGLLMIGSYPIICAICDFGNYDSFHLILGIISIFFEFIGLVFAMYGGRKIFTSLKDQNGEAKYKAMQLFFGGIATIAIAQGYYSFLL